MVFSHVQTYDARTGAAAGPQPQHRQQAQPDRQEASADAEEHLSPEAEGFYEEALQTCPEHTPAA